jgi:hypothetical protein
VQVLEQTAKPLEVEALVQQEILGEPHQALEHFLPPSLPMHSKE